jgi:hypothetical protein
VPDDERTNAPRADLAAILARRAQTRDAPGHRFVDTR